MAVREAPEGFVRQLKMQCGSDWDVRFNTHVNRWEFLSLSAGGIQVSQFLGWTRNPLTGAKIEPDPVTGLTPFRELDATAQAEILRNLERSYIGNRFDGSSGWKDHSRKVTEYNKALDANRNRKRGETFADLIKEVDLRRRWKKDHVRNQGPPLITYAK